MLICQYRDNTSVQPLEADEMSEPPREQDTRAKHNVLVDNADNCTESGVAEWHSIAGAPLLLLVLAKVLQSRSLYFNV
jgi:hypothetical protein